jgi:heme exporter protein D
MVHHDRFVMWIAVGVAVLSLIAAVITLTLIKKLNKWNGYLLLVASLTVSQSIYDISFLLLPFYNIGSVKRTYYFLSTVGGLTATIWSNVLVLLIFEIVLSLRSVDVMKRVISMRM